MAELGVRAVARGLSLVCVGAVCTSCELCVVLDGPHRRVRQVLVGWLDQTDQDECRVCVLSLCGLWFILCLFVCV